MPRALAVMSGRKVSRAGSIQIQGKVVLARRPGEGAGVIVKMDSKFLRELRAGQSIEVLSTAIVRKNLHWSCGKMTLRK